MTKPVDDDPLEDQEGGLNLSHFTADAARGQISVTPSTWVAIVILIFVATTTYPTFHALFILAIVACLLFVLRWVAHLEGKYS